MRREIEVLFAYGNYWLDDKAMKAYIDVADKVATHPKTAFWFNKVLQDVIQSKKPAELDVIKDLIERFPASIAMKRIKSYLDTHLMRGTDNVLLVMA